MIEMLIWILTLCGLVMAAGLLLGLVYLVASVARGLWRAWRKPEGEPALPIARPESYTLYSSQAPAGDDEFRPNPYFEGENHGL